MRILAVDDNSHALRYIRAAFSKAGYSPTVTGDPDEALHFMQANRPTSSSSTSSFQIPMVSSSCRNSATSPTSLPSSSPPTATTRSSPGPSTWAPPITSSSPSPYRARRQDQAALRKHASPKLADPSEPYSHGDLTIDYSQRRVALAGRVLTYRHLLYSVWGGRNSGDVRPIRTAVKDLRRKLRDDASNPSFIFAEPRVGYRMAGD